MNLTHNATVGIYSPAKVNIMLEVLGRREDGFHELDTLMQTISLKDSLIFTESSNKHSLISNNSQIPLGENNIILKAIRLIQQKTNMHRRFVQVQIIKNIPVSAGMGGGSSNAASTLLALNQLWNLHLAFDDLVDLSRSLGADVTFFLYQGLCRCRGIGQDVSPLSNVLEGDLLIFNPGFGVSTPAVYQKLSQRVPFNPLFEVDAFLNHLARDSSPYSIRRHWFNRLESASFEVAPQLASIKDKLENLLDVSFLVSGSGATLFTVLDSEVSKDALKAVQLHFPNAFSFKAHWWNQELFF